MAERPLTLIERIERIEKVLPEVEINFYRRFESAIDQIKDTLKGLVDILNASIKVNSVELGKNLEPLVQEQVRLQIRTRTEKAFNETYAILQQLVSQGKYKAAETIEPKSIIIVDQYDPDGQLVNGFGKFQYEFSQLKEEIQMGLLGKAVGAEYGSESIGKVVVKEIYSPVQPETADTAEVK